jgi:hypothetical protein
MPGALALDAGASQQQEHDFPKLFHPQQANVAPFDTVFQQEQGRGIKLVTEEPMPRRFRHIAFSPDAVPRSARSWRVPASCSPLFLLLA